MRRGLPLGPTLLVLIAVPAMIALGFWQLDRRAQKEELLARLTGAATLPAVNGFDIYTSSFHSDFEVRVTGSYQGLDFRRARVDCVLPAQVPQVQGGTSRDGIPGFVYLAICHARQEEPSRVDYIRLPLIAGWSPRPDLKLNFALERRHVTGVLRRRNGPVASLPDPLGRVDGFAVPYVLIPDTALPPLQPSRQPSIEDIPNNHLSYAIQWFFFAATLVVIYALYVRRWRRGG